MTAEWMFVELKKLYIIDSVWIQLVEFIYIISVDYVWPCDALESSMYLQI
jgi:hypothetical protein